jgi:hypothetical protein
LGRGFAGFFEGEGTSPRGFQRKNLNSAKVPSECADNMGVARQVASHQKELAGKNAGRP